MDGSVSTPAPLFAAALATKQSWPTFLVGLAASIGAGISMGFAEALSDDGSLTGRGRPLVRGIACGLMTTLGGLGRTEFSTKVLSQHALLPCIAAMQLCILCSLSTVHSRIDPR